MNQTIDLSKIALLCFCVTKDEHIPGNLRHSSASECSARRSQNFLRFLVGESDITSRRHPVSSRPRLTHLLRDKLEDVHTVPDWTDDRADRGFEVKTAPFGAMWSTAEVQNKNPLRVVNAKVLFPPPSCIASFAKVGLEYDHPPYSADHLFDANG
jgi:hypothetical protein